MGNKKFPTVTKKYIGEIGHVISLQLFLHVIHTPFFLTFNQDESCKTHEVKRTFYTLLLNYSVPKAGLEDLNLEDGPKDQMVLS